MGGEDSKTKQYNRNGRKEEPSRIQRNVKGGRKKIGEWTVVQKDLRWHKENMALHVMRQVRRKPVSVMGPGEKLAMECTGVGKEVGLKREGTTLW